MAHPILKVITEKPFGVGGLSRVRKGGRKSKEVAYAVYKSKRDLYLRWNELLRNDVEIKEKQHEN